MSRTVWVVAAIAICTFVNLSVGRAGGDAQRASAEKLCRLLVSEARYEKSIDTGGQLLVAELAKSGHPVPEAQRANVRHAVAKVTSYDEMIGDAATLFAEKYSLDELHELTAFYESPIGQRSLLLPELLDAAGAKIGRAVSERIEPELRQLGLSLPESRK